MHPVPDQSKLVRVREVQECAGTGNFTMLATIVEIDEIKRYSLELFRYAYVLCMHACCVCTVCVLDACECGFQISRSAIYEPV